jgi:hypothetical protein
MGGVAVLHAWIYVANPAGLFASDNWALPFVRLGLEPPARFPEAAARALALAADGAMFYVEQLAATTDLTVDAARAIERILAARADTVGRWLASRPGQRFDEAELEWLAKLWTETWSAARATSPYRTPAARSHEIVIARHDVADLGIAHHLALHGCEPVQGLRREVDQRPDLAGLAVQDVANAVHADPQG